MPADLPADVPLQEGLQGPSSIPVEPSRQASTYLTMKQAAQAAGCSESTLRRLVKASEVPFLQEDTTAGFRYLFRSEDVPLIAHKSSMRRPRGRRVESSTIQPSTSTGLQEASTLREELASARTERDLLRAENARLWAQIERLTESVTRLALPERSVVLGPPAPSSTSGFWEGSTGLVHGSWWGRGRLVVPVGGSSELALRGEQAGSEPGKPQP